MDKHIKDYLSYIAYQRHYSDLTIENYKNDLLFFKDYLDKNKLSFLDIDYSNIRDINEYYKAF